jgi:hypothetical protein
MAEQAVWIESETGNPRFSYRIEIRRGAYRVVVDSAERYPWKFGGVPTERRRLPAGDYAVEVHGELAGRRPASHAARVLSELHVLHPTVQIIYAGSRKAVEQLRAPSGYTRADV